MQPSILAPGRGRPYVDGDALDHTAPLVFAVPGVLDDAACGRLIARVEELGPGDVPVATTNGFVIRPDVRNNKRVMFDDAALAGELYAKVFPALPPRLCGVVPCGANERFRCYRYEPGQQFRAHHDGSYHRDANECSLLTLMVYLNDGFDGGETRFLDLDVAVRPRTGMALLFQHHLLHEGSVVRSGVKYVLRSDVMYRVPA
jgi:prolyl 4-hydroxylase